MGWHQILKLYEWDLGLNRAATSHFSDKHK